MGEVSGEAGENLSKGTRTKRMKAEIVLQIIERVIEITERSEDLDSIGFIVAALKAGKQIVVINRNGKLTCYIEQG
jgi:hypothetical protein